MIEILVNIDVDDLARGVAFYVDGFGFTVGRRFGADAVELLGAAARLYLLAKPAGSRASADGEARRSYERHWTPVHLDFVVDDIDVAVARARAAGARLEGDVQTRTWGKMALLADPFGHGVCVIQYVGRGYDAIADGQAMG
jgi:predicted enzyme related to lactoylglutathione lyase